MLLQCSIQNLSEPTEQIEPHSFTHVGFMRAIPTDEKNRLSYVGTPAHNRTEPAMTSALRRREGGMEGGEEKRRRNAGKEAIIQGNEKGGFLGKEKKINYGLILNSIIFF